MAVVGPPNSGKSYAWKSYSTGEDVFAICPSSKFLFVRHSSGDRPSPLDIALKGKGNSIAEIRQNVKLDSDHKVISGILKQQVDPADLKISGDYVQCSDVRYVASYKRFVSTYMQDKGIILTPDFTHYISYIVQSKAFRSRSAGGQAFARFWDMAADTLANVILSSDDIREDMLDITEYHVDYDESLGVFRFNVPFGKMLSEKFQPESYYDLVLYTKVLPHETEPDETKRFKFITVKRDAMDGRSMGLFADISVEGMIPNDMGLVIDRIKSL